jgi:nucleoside diphosphate kinase
MNRTRTWRTDTVSNADHPEEDAPRAVLGAEHAPAIPASLSVVPAKRALFAVDTYFRESWEDLREFRSDSVEQLLHRHATLLLKPDAVVGRRLDAALGWLRERGATVAAAERVRLSRHQARAMWQYQWNVATRERRDLCDLIAQRGDALLLVVRMPEDGTPATVRLSAMKGPADPAHRQRWQLRHRLGGHNYLLNFIHTADEPADLVRDLGVLFDAPQRRELYDAMLHGHDKDEQARHRVAELYRATNPHSLSFSDVVHRMKERVDDDGSEVTGDLLTVLNAADEGLTVGWRELCDLAARAGVPVHSWDRIVLGTHLMVASQFGTPILSAVSADDWERRGGDNTTSGAANASPTLRYSQTVPRQIVHKAGIGEVLVTDSARTAPDEFVVAAELPATHSYYSDTPGSTKRFDLMQVLEVGRQAAYTVLHEHLGIPGDRKFLIRGYRTHLRPQIVFAEQPAPPQVVVTCRIEQHRDRPGKATRTDLSLDVSTADGTPVATASLAVCWVGPAKWERLRSSSRARHQLPGEVGTMAPRPALVRPRSVGREAERNVLLANPNIRDGRFSAEILVNPGNRGMFEHEQDHVPGMVQMEAARQVSIWSVADSGGLPPETIAVRGLDATFSAMAELDLPLRIAGTARSAGRSGTVDAEILQNDVQIFRASVDVA